MRGLLIPYYTLILYPPTGISHKISHIFPSRNFAASSASYLANFASFSGLSALGGVASRRIFRQLGGRGDRTPRYTRLILYLVSVSSRKEDSCLYIIRTTVIPYISGGILAKLVLSVKLQSWGNSPQPSIIVPSSARNGCRKQI